MKLRPYTELQQAIIDGKVDNAKVRENAISCLLRKAKRLGDEQVVQLAEKIHQIFSLCTDLTSAATRKNDHYKASYQ